MNFSELNIVDNRVKALNLLKITEDNVTVLSEAFFKIEKRNLDKIDVDSDKVEFLANFTVYLESKDDEETYYSFDIKTDTLLNVNYSLSEEDSMYRYFILDMNDNLFENNFYKNDVATSYLFFSQIIWEV